jgi:amino acid transporter
MAIGIGGMVGGGIFAVLGTAVEFARGATPLAFALAGLIALLTAHSYARLSASCPSAGGTVSFLDRAFGVDLWTGAVNLLLWFSYLVTIGLYARAFGAYGSRLLVPEPSFALEHLLLSAAIALPVAINLLNADLVSRTETYVVVAKLTILVGVAASGMNSVESARLSMETWLDIPQIVAGSMVIFVAYEGFELIANAGEDTRDPQRSLPRALYGSVVFVMALYVALSVVTVGSLPASAIDAAKEYALAAAARPALGPVGFTMVGVAALLSTFSAVNATLYGDGRLAYMLARDGELPEIFEQRVWSRPIGAVAATGCFALLIANFLDVTEIAIIASAGFLLIFTSVNLAACKLAREIGSSRWIPVLSALASGAALATLLAQASSANPRALTLIVSSWAACVVGEFFYQRVSQREFRVGRKDTES